MVHEEGAVLSAPTIEKALQNYDKHAPQFTPAPCSPTAEQFLGGAILASSEGGMIIQNVQGKVNELGSPLTLLPKVENGGVGTALILNRAIADLTLWHLNDSGTLIVREYENYGNGPWALSGVYDRDTYPLQFSRDTPSVVARTEADNLATAVRFSHHAQALQAA
jgi:hypothetical protein